MRKVEVFYTLIHHPNITFYLNLYKNILALHFDIFCMFKSLVLLLHLSICLHSGVAAQIYQNSYFLWVILSENENSDISPSSRDYWYSVHVSSPIPPHLAWSYRSSTGSNISIVINSGNEALDSVLNRNLYNSDAKLLFPL